MSTEKLQAFKPRQPFFVGIDSDGCAFDTMELKHKECFCPCFINVFELQSVSKYAREVWEFGNLYSKWRGANRFPEVVMCLDWLRARPEVQRRDVTIPALPRLREWIAWETKLGNPALKAAVAATGDEELAWVLRWSEAVNTAVDAMVRGCPPFPGVREALEALQGQADCMVVSATPEVALQKEWSEHGIGAYMALIAGQESGTKEQHLALATKGKYAAGRVLMIGDALGDYKAAQANHALFFPINPGHEEASWAQLVNEGLHRFLTGTFAGTYQDELVARFKHYLPETPPWQQV
jgi:phosphoglycolate phosphatase-like HAD superfamily hydrolase